MKVTNNGQFTNLFTKKQISFPTTLNDCQRDIIHDECNKPLQSKWYVDSKQKSKFNWKYKSTSGFTVRKSGGLWLVYDRPKQVKTSKETLQAQRKLYNQLKKEYEQSLKASDDVDVVTQEDKLRNITRKKTINMISGLSFAPRYDRIYAND